MIKQFFLILMDALIPLTCSFIIILQLQSGHPSVLVIGAVVIFGCIAGFFMTLGAAQYNHNIELTQRLLRTPGYHDVDLPTGHKIPNRQLRFLKSFWSAQYFAPLPYTQ